MAVDRTLVDNRKDTVKGEVRKGYAHIVAGIELITDELDIHCPDVEIAQQRAQAAITILKGGDISSILAQLSPDQKWAFDMVQAGTLSRGIFDGLQARADSPSNPSTVEATPPTIVAIDDMSTKLKAAKDAALEMATAGTAAITSGKLSDKKLVTKFNDTVEATKVAHSAAEQEIEVMRRTSASSTPSTATAPAPVRELNSGSDPRGSMPYGPRTSYAS